MKTLALTAALLIASVLLAGCPEGAGDPNVGANPAPRETSVGKRPGTPGGPPATKPASGYDPSGGGRPGM